MLNFSIANCRGVLDKPKPGVVNVCYLGNLNK